MVLKIQSKKRRDLIFSILCHLLLFIIIFRVFDQDSALAPTSTIGYQVELVNFDISKKLHPSDYLSKHQNINTSRSIFYSNTKTEVNVKTKISREKLQTATHLFKKNIGKIIPLSKQLKQQQGVLLTNKNQIQLVASAPTGIDNQVGDGDKTNSSTNGNGIQSGIFDFRVIQYGRDAAYAIDQKIILPDNLRYIHITYRAFVVLDHNMQFQSMQMIKSTGYPQLDSNISKALRETVYPPLPINANWDQFHNIDFTIK